MEEQTKRALDQFKRDGYKSQVVMDKYMKNAGSIPQVELRPVQEFNPRTDWTKIKESSDKYLENLKEIIGGDELANWYHPLETLTLQTLKTIATFSGTNGSMSARYERSLKNKHFPEFLNTQCNDLDALVENEEKRARSHKQTAIKARHETHKLMCELRKNTRGIVHHEYLERVCSDMYNDYSTEWQKLHEADKGQAEKMEAVLNSVELDRDRARQNKEECEQLTEDSANKIIFFEKLLADSQKQAYIHQRAWLELSQVLRNYNLEKERYKSLVDDSTYLDKIGVESISNLSDRIDKLDEKRDECNAKALNALAPAGTLSERAPEDEFESMCENNTRRVVSLANDILRRGA